jgi:quercetin dioxygenase-like cupin family protein
MPQTTTHPQNPTVLRSGEGDARWWFGQLAVLKATGESTGGAYTLVEINVAPGYRTPLHVHHREDEGFWVIDGHATFTVGEETIEAPAGTYLFGPRDVPHWWMAGPDGAHVLYLFTPSGIEALIEDMSVPALALTPPPRDVTPPRNAPDIARQYGCEILPMS